MKNLLLKNFLTTPQLYGRAQTRWRKFLDSLPRKTVGPREPYLAVADDLDGNPLYHAYFPRRGRALRIVQLDPREATEYPPLIGWVATVPLGERGGPTPELVVFLVLTKKTERLAQAWIRSWLVEGTSPRTLEGMIRRDAILSP